MKTTNGCVLLILCILGTAEAVSAETIGGSVLRNPPQFQLNSFVVALVGSRQEAHPFHVIPGDGWLPERLEVPLYHYEGMAGDRASFSIWSDVSGLPGSPLATFPVSNITTEQRVLSLAPSYVSGLLEGDTTYWLVGTNTGQGQVNWNMDKTTGDFTRAYRIAGGDWVLQSHLGNISAFAVLGSPVPEPSSMVLLGAGIIGLLAYAERKPRVAFRGSR